MQTGEQEDLLLLIKHNAGFLVGKLVVYRPRKGILRWIENADYTFVVLATVESNETKKHPTASIVCPVCSEATTMGMLREHLRSEHRLSL